MIIVFTLIGILVGLGLPQYQTAARRAREAVLKEDLFQFRKLIDQYYLDKRKYPASLQTLVEEKYLRTIPVDPMTNSATTWVEVRETPSPDEYRDAWRISASSTSNQARTKRPLIIRSITPGEIRAHG